MRTAKIFAVATLFIVGSVIPSLIPAQQSDVKAAVRKEDWGAIALDPASLDPLSYAVIGKGEFPGFTRELLRVQWRSADPIDLFIIKPRGAEKPPVALYLYGYPADTARFWDDGWCKRATQGGMAAVGFVSALTGQRYANRPMKEWFVSELQEALGATTHDVQMILNYLATRKDISADQVAMFGQGSGATIAVLAAAADTRITVLDLLDPWGDWPEWLQNSPEVPDEERTAYLQPEFLKRVANLDPVLYLPRLKLRALRLQQVVDEPITPLAAKEKIAAATKPDQRVSYKNEREHLDAWRVTGLSGWMRNRMIGPSESTSSAAH